MKKRVAKRQQTHLQTTKKTVIFIIFFFLNRLYSFTICQFFNSFINENAIFMQTTPHVETLWTAVAWTIKQKKIRSAKQIK